MIVLKNSNKYLCYLNNPCCYINNYFFKIVNFKNFNILYKASKSIEEVNFDYDDYNYYHCNLKGAINYFKENNIDLDNVIFFAILLNPYDRYINFYNSSNTNNDKFDEHLIIDNHFINFFPDKFRIFKKYKIDYIIKFENFKEDLDFFCNEINIDFEINNNIFEKIEINERNNYNFNELFSKFIENNFKIDLIEYSFKNNHYYKKSFAIMIPIFNEYDYINFFIEYHKNLGFDKFYILIDDSSEIQADYIIKDNLIPYLEFFRLTDIYSKSDINNILFNANHKSKLVHTALQYIFSKINEDYVITLGADSFLYLNELTIQDFLFKNNISSDITQIFFNWINIFNKNFDNEYNLLNELNNEKYTYSFSNHFFTLCQKKYIENLDITSHFYKCKKNIKNICWCNNETFVLDNNNVFNDIVNLKNNNFIPEYGCVIHFIFRNIKDIFIKSYYSWNNNKDNISKIINNLIKNNDHPKKILGTGFRLDFLDYLKSKNKKLNFKFNFNYKSIVIENFLFKTMLNEINIDEKIFFEWIDKYIIN